MQSENSNDYTPSSKCFCGGELEKFAYARDSYKQCSKCGTFISQHPPPDSLVEFYGFKQYWHDRQQSLGQPVIENRVGNDILDGRVFFLLDFIHKHCGGAEVQKVLEIGCAPGILIKLLSITG